MLSQTFRIVSGVVLTCLLGCHSQTIDNHATLDLREARASAERRAVYPTCKDPAMLGGGCGLITKYTSTEDFRTKFRERKCAAKTDDDCEAAFQKAIDAWLGQRYRFADWKTVAVACDANPGRCEDPVAYELMLVDSHNFHNRDSYARTENRIEAERREAQAEHLRQQVDGVTKLLGEVAYETHKGPKCRSYPSAFAGVTNTVCEP